MGNYPKIVVVAGPTASGKSDLALRLAQDFDGELICSSDFIPTKDLHDLLTKNNLFDVKFNKEILY